MKSLSKTCGATNDVDLIVGVSGYAEWVELQTHLRKKGFRESPEDTVTCRMRLDDLLVDFMPDDPAILGFSNRWYPRGIEKAVPVALSDTCTILRLTPELFVATKLEAYLGRGGGDLLTSRDLEDILLLFDGRPEIVSEILQADQDVRVFIAGQLDALMKEPEFDSFVEGNIRGPQGRVDIVRNRFDTVRAIVGRRPPIGPRLSPSRVRR